MTVTNMHTNWMFIASSGNDNCYLVIQESINHLEVHIMAAILMVLCIDDSTFFQLDRHMRRLDQDLSRFTIELEADTAGITEILEQSEIAYLLFSIDCQ